MFATTVIFAATLNIVSGWFPGQGHHCVFLSTPIRKIIRAHPFILRCIARYVSHTYVDLSLSFMFHLSSSTQLMREALGEVQARIVAVETASDDEDGNRNGIGNGAPAAGLSSATTPIKPTVKGNAHIRITHLPPLSDLCKPNISAIRGTDLGALIQIQVNKYEVCE